MGTLITLIYVGLAPLSASHASEVGPRLYNLYCATCHGTRGDGLGESARLLAGPSPQDFTRGVYKFRSTLSGGLPTDADLMRTVRRGIPGTSMPAWAGILDDTQVAAVVAHIKGFSPRFATRETSEVIASPKTVPEPTVASIERGRNVFLLMKCFLCHGTRGAGDGPDAPALKDARGLRIDPRDLRRGEFKGGGAARDIFRTLATGIDGTPMVAYFANPEVLGRPLVRLRKAFSKDVLSHRALNDQDRRRIEKFMADLPSASKFDDMEEKQQEALVRGWQWDLVHYIRDLAGRGSWWRRFLGLTPSRPLFGAGKEE
ncbi:MAG: c-type cytochrome [Deltaproteobacteria bacterium]|nr:c-type cytochrome [Deltaproteobacteria bacterium]